MIAPFNGIYRGGPANKKRAALSAPPIEFF
jgi:hypothetical protein